MNEMQSERNEKVEDWLALFHAPGLKPKTLDALLDHFGDARSVCAASASELAEFNVSQAAQSFLRAPASEFYDADLRWLDDPLNHIVPKPSPSYPAQLKNLSGAPPVLFVRGDVKLLNDPQIAIVGSRTPTPSGKEQVAEFAAALARKGLVITSGLAKGIDAGAHRTALNINAPTIAVVATGINVCYPSAHQSLAQRIVACGALVSEFSVNTTPRPEHFPQRNRIISGLAMGVLVVEAGHKSGALTTARFSGEYGRDVFAIPSSIRNPMAQGCHRLIQQGAKLVQSPDDVFVDIAARIQLEPPADLAPEAPAKPGKAGTDDADLDAAYRGLLECMGYEPVMPDTLVERSGLAAAEVASMLLVLEMKGCVASDNGFYTRV